MACSPAPPRAFAAPFMMRLYQGDPSRSPGLNRRPGPPSLTRSVEMRELGPGHGQEPPSHARLGAVSDLEHTLHTPGRQGVRSTCARAAKTIRSVLSERQGKRRRMGSRGEAQRRRIRSRGVRNGARRPDQPRGGVHTRVDRPVVRSVRRATLVAVHAAAPRFRDVVRPPSGVSLVRNRATPSSACVHVNGHEGHLITGRSTRGWSPRLTNPQDLVWYRACG